MDGTQHDILNRIGAEFHQTMGECIANWAHVEDRLFHYCWAVLGCTKQQAAIVYCKTPTIDSRLVLVTELLPTIFPEIPTNGHQGPYPIQIWTGIAEAMRKLLKTRNKIAHQPALPNVVWGEHLEGAPEVAVEISETPRTLSWYEIYESHSELARGRGEPTSLTITELKKHRVDVAGLVFNLVTFYQDHVLKHAPESPLTRFERRSD